MDRIECQWCKAQNEPIELAVIPAARRWTSKKLVSRLGLG